MAYHEERFMTNVQRLLYTDQQALFADIMRWASLRQLGPAHTADVLVQVARAIQRAILHLEGPAGESASALEETN